MHVQFLATLVGLGQSARHARKNVGQAAINDQRDNPAWSTYPSDWPFLKHCLEPESPGGLLNYNLSQCRSGQSSDFGRNARIAIVGGGPGGVSVAKLLDDRGFKNIKLFESSDRLGGKSKRYDVDGEAHELGTCFLSGKYECIQTWGERMGMHEDAMKPEHLYTILNGGRVASSLEGAALQAKEMLGISPQDFRVIYGDAMKRYPIEWTKTMGQQEYMFPSEDTVDMTALNQTYRSWLEERDLLALLPYFVRAMNAQGYGDPKDVPALYGLMWNHPNFVVGGSFGTGTVRMFREGFQTLWERLAGSTQVDVQLNTPVTKIVRTDKGATIHYRSPTSIFSKKESFDWVVMAAPMPKALPLVADATSEERDLFKEYNFHELSMSAYRMPETGALDKDFEMVSYADRLPVQTDYYRMSLGFRNRLVRKMYDADGVDGPTAIRNTANLKGFKHPVAGTLQITDFRVSDDELDRLVQEDAQALGSRMEKLHVERWDYMPFYSQSEVVQDRKPWRIWNLQGQRRTWWVGSHVSFESVADIVDYSVKLLNARLCE